MSKPKSKMKKVKKEKKKDSFSKRMGCTDDVDIFTQEKLPKNLFNILVLNNKKPFHCAEVESFYSYWKSEANEGKDVKNPFTGEKLSDKQLTKIFRKIKRKHPNDKKPKVREIQIQHGWDSETGMQTREVIDLEAQRQAFRRRQRIERIERIEARPEPPHRFRFISDEFQDLLDDSDVDSHDLRGQPFRRRRPRRFTLDDLSDDSDEFRNLLDDEIDSVDGGRKKRKKRKNIRRHSGINQKTGRLKKGYKYSGKLKSGLSKIVKVKRK